MCLLSHSTDLALFLPLSSVAGDNGQVSLGLVEGEIWTLFDQALRFERRQACQWHAAGSEITDNKLCVGNNEH